MNKKRIFAMLSVLLLVCALLFFAWWLLRDSNTKRLVFLEEGSPICYADTYWDMTAVVSKSGNVYIRGPLMYEEYTFGIPNVAEYNDQYHSLNVWKTDRFAQIYNGSDAVSVTLSMNGGVIVTQKQEVYVFCELEDYRLPTRLCDNAVSAILAGNRVYLLTPKGELEYIDLNGYSDRIRIQESVQSFCITSQDQSIWVLNDNHTLFIYPGGDLTVSPVLCHTETLSFDADCTIDRRKPEPQYRIGILTLDGAVFYYDGWGFPAVEADAFEQIPIEQALDVELYRHGIIVLDQEHNAKVYGRELYEMDEFNGKIVACNVRTVNAGALGICFVTNDNRHLYAGSLPSSDSVELDELVEE